MSKPRHNEPTRLRESEAFGHLLRDVRPEGFDSARLEASRTRLIARMDQESAPVYPRFRPSPGRRRAAQVVFAALLLLSMGAAALYYFNPSNAPSVADSASDKRTDERPPHKAHQPPIEKESPEPHPATLPSPPDIASMPDAGVAIDPESRNTRPLRSEKASGRGSALDAQVALFNQAKAAAAAGRYQSALETITRLQRRYPKGPLRLESEELKAHSLAGLHRHHEAVKTIKALIHAGIPPRKKAQLYRFLGDLQLKGNRCEEAVESYRRALGLGLTSKESDAAKAGISKCGS